MTDRDLVVRTAQGAVRGNRTDDHAVFLGVPYASPPVGAGRFASPRPHDPWEGVMEATESGPTAPQGPRRLGTLDMAAYFGPGWVRGSDYLTVNIWTPRTTRPGAPVMVFVHGGGFVAGSNRSLLYDGSRFARDGVVLVTVTVMTEALFVAGSRDLADAHAAQPGFGTFRYEFAWRSPALGGQLGAAPAVEVPFVFDVTDQPGLLGPDALRVDDQRHRPGDGAGRSPAVDRPNRSRFRRHFVAGTGFFVTQLGGTAP